MIKYLSLLKHYAIWNIFLVNCTLYREITISHYSKIFYLKPNHTKIKKDSSIHNEIYNLCHYIQMSMGTLYNFIATIIIARHCYIPSVLNPTTLKLN